MGQIMAISLAPEGGAADFLQLWDPAGPRVKELGCREGLMQRRQAPSLLMSQAVHALNLEKMWIVKMKSPPSRGEWAFFQST